MASPTQQADYYFDHASSWLTKTVAAGLDGKTPAADYHTAVGLTNIAMGLGHLSVGLRATYMKLEEIERLLKQQTR